MLRLFGKPAHAGVGLFPARGYELLAISALSSPDGTTRSDACSLLWPHVDRSRAFANLRYVISAIRKWQDGNGMEVFTFRGEWICGTGKSDLELLISGGSVSLGELLSSELLAGGEGTGEEFESWLRVQRLAVDDKLLSRFLETVDEATDATLIAARNRFPYDERVFRERLDRLVKNGRAAQAAAEIEQFRDRIREDLGISISPETSEWIAAALPQIAAHPKPEEHRPPVSQRSLPRVAFVPPVYTGPSSLIAKALVSEVTIVLCSLRTFAMFAPYTARQIAFDDAGLVATNLGADYLVQATLSSRYRMTFVLAHMASGQVLAAESIDLRQYESSRDDLIKSVATSISRHVAALETAEYQRTGNETAYVHYLLGCERLKYDLAAVRRARRHFTSALDLYPHFVPAKAMLARTLNMEWLLLSRGDKELLNEAGRLADEALEIDPLAPSGHWEKGHSLLYLQQMDESLLHMQTARRRAPNLADLIADEADVLVHLGEGSLAKQKIAEAIHLNPLPPDEYRWVKGSAEFVDGDFVGALSTLESMQDIRPVARMMAASAAMLGQKSKASRYRNIWLERYPDFKIRDWLKVVPVKKPEVIERTVSAMRLAGFS